MDDKDFEICRALLEDSRTSYSDLGKMIGLTPQAVHRRVQNLLDTEVIKRFTANLSFKSSGLMWLVVFGFSRHPSMKALVERLGKDPHVAVVLYCSGNYIYIHAGVRDADDMANFVGLLQKEADISDLHVGIMPGTGRSEDVTLDSMDLRIIHSLKDDARKPVSDIAVELKSTAKTIRRRLERLKRDGLVSFSIRWQPDTIGDVISNIHLELKDDSRTEDVSFSLISRNIGHISSTYAFSNMPRRIIVTHWSENMRILWKTCEDLESKGMFKSVMPNIIRGAYHFRDPRDRVLEQMLAGRSER